jgi:hypothetical protein
MASKRSSVAHRVRALRSVMVVAIILVLSGLLLLCACGGGSSAKTPPAISVSLTPSAQTKIDLGQTLDFTASVSNDSSGKGVTWTVSGTGCSGSACGTFTNSTATAVTYNAPASVSANMTVMVQATSAADTSKSKSAPVVVSPEPTITTTTLASGAVGTAYNASLQVTGGAGALTWSLASGSSLPAGLSLSSLGTISGTPTTAGKTTFTVKVTDASGGKEGPCSQTQQLSITITPPPISVSLAPSAQTNIDQGQTLNFTATVSNDSSNKGVTWAASGATCSGVACGTFTNSTTSAATYNAPTSVSANMTVTVRATSVADTTKSASTAVAVSPLPSITTTTLASGLIGTAYSASLQATGGAGSLTWNLASGSSLPTGLSLSAAGAISGTPTAAGTTTFTVKVTDASQGQPGPASATQQLSIMIVSAPLTIITTSLPNATMNVAYSAPLQASGGTTPYTWTVASGSSLPSWLALGGSGTNWSLSGTPTATGTFTFSLTVTDSTKPTAASKTQALSLTVGASTACGSGNEGALSGQYAFSLGGYNASGFMGAIGSFTADGSGHITAGTVDSNGISLGVKNGSVTTSGSSYSVGSDNRGCATIVTPFYTFKTRFALDTTSGAATGGAIQEWEPAPNQYIASGLILKQTVPTSLPNGVWVYEQFGVFSTSQTRTAVAGTLTASNGSVTAGEYDSNAGGSHVTHSGLSGTYTAPVTPTGRFTTTTSLSGIAAHRAAYLVSGTRFLEITTDTLGSTTSALIGDARLQGSSLTLNGNLAFYTSGIVSGGAGGIIDFGRVTITGSSLTASVYEDEAGTWATPAPFTETCGFAIDSYGKVTLSGTNCQTNAPVIYLYGANTGWMLGAGSSTSFGHIEPQSATTITSGIYFFGTQMSDHLSVETGTGTATLASAGATGTGDNTSTTSPLQADQPVSETFTVNSDGTFSTSDHPGVVSGVIVSNSKIVAVDNQTSAYPTMLVISAVP